MQCSSLVGRPRVETTILSLSRPILSTAAAVWGVDFTPPAGQQDASNRTPLPAVPVQPTARLHQPRNALGSCKSDTPRTPLQSACCGGDWAMEGSVSKLVRSCGWVGRRKASGIGAKMCASDARNAPSQRTGAQPGVACLPPGRPVPQVLAIASVLGDVPEQRGHRRPHRWGSCGEEERWKPTCPRCARELCISPPVSTYQHARFAGRLCVQRILTRLGHRWSVDEECGARPGL